MSEARMRLWLLTRPARFQRGVSEMGRRRWPFQMVPNLLAEGQRVLDELRREIEDGHRGAGAAAHGGTADGAGTGAGAGAAGAAAEGYAAAYAAARRAAEIAGLSLAAVNDCGQMAALQHLNAMLNAQVQQQAFLGLGQAVPLGFGSGYTTAPAVAVGGMTAAPESKIEDAGITVGELVGWRWWLVMNGRLASVVMNVDWQPGNTLCTDVSGKWDGSRGDGIHAFKDRDEAARANDVPGMLMAFGSVSLWGTVIEHERGYRAQYAKVRSLDRVEWLHPSNGSRLSDEGTLAALRRVYGVEGAG